MNIKGTRRIISDSAFAGSVASSGGEQAEYKECADAEQTRHNAISKIGHNVRKKFRPLGMDALFCRLYTFQTFA